MFFFRSILIEFRRSLERLLTVYFCKIKDIFRGHFISLELNGTLEDLSKLWGHHVVEYQNRLVSELADYSFSIWDSFERVDFSPLTEFRDQARTDYNDFFITSLIRSSLSLFSKYSDVLFERERESVSNKIITFRCHRIDSKNGVKKKTNDERAGSKWMSLYDLLFLGFFWNSIFQNLIDDKLSSSQSRMDRRLDDLMSCSSLFSFLQDHLGLRPLVFVIT